MYLPACIPVSVSAVLLCGHVDLGFSCQCVCVHLYRRIAVWVYALSVPSHMCEKEGVT